MGILLSRFKLFALILFVFFLVGGCGGSRPSQSTIESGVPEELVKAFEVTDTQVPESTAPTLPSEAEKVESKKEKKKQKKKAKKKKKKAVKKKEESKGFLIPYRRPANDPVWVGEKVWMDVTWLGATAGEFLLEVLPFKYLKGRKVYHFKGTAKTSSIFSLIYRAEDWIESFVDFEGWFPYKFRLHGDESRHIRNNLELFDHGAKKQYVYIHDNRLSNGIHEEKGYKDLKPLSQDSLSAVYYVRTQNLEVGKTIKFPMTTSGSQWDTDIKVLEREEIRTGMGYRRALKTKVETRFNGVLQQQGDQFIWFSDDPRHFLLRFEAKVKIGWISGIATKIEPGTQPEPEKPRSPDAEPAYAPIFEPPENPQ